MNTKKLYLISFFLLIAASLPAAALAEVPPAPAPAPANVGASPASSACGSGKFCLNVPVGNLKEFTIDASGTAGSGSLLGQYIMAWYGFLLGVIGILATVMIMWGGFKYLTSRGDKGMIDAAKTNIISAITGVVLAFGTYTILSLVNPALLTISMPSLSSIAGGSGVVLERDAVATGVAAGAPNLTPLASGSAITSPETSDWNSLGRLSGTQTLVTNATNLMNGLQAQGNLPAGITVTSAYRPGTGQSYHTTGQAFDVTWPGITQESAQAFVNSVSAADPSFSTIIETHGEYGSSWRQYGMGVHLDIRQNTVHLP